MATERLNFRKKNIQIFFFSEAIRGMKLTLCINVHDISLYINCIFYCRCPCAFVAMATQSFHIHVLIMGKVELGINYINCIFFYCRCPCAFVAMATQSFHIHVLIMGKVELGINNINCIFFFLLSLPMCFRCYGNSKFPYTCSYNGKSGNWHLFLSYCRYFDKMFTEMFWE